MLYTFIEYILHLHLSQKMVLSSICFIIGIVFAFTLPISLQFVLIVLLLSIVCIGLLRSDGFRFIAILTCIFCTACIRVDYIPEYNNPYGEYITFIGEIVREPEIRIDTQRIVVQSEAIQGLVQLTRPLQPRYLVGQVLEIRCVLRQPEAFDGFAYDKYLERYGVSTLCRYPGIEQVSEAVSWRSIMFGWKATIVQRFSLSLPAPEHTIVLGAVFGDKRAVPPHISEAFRITGTSHLLVISGMHVSILITIITRILQTFRLSQQWAIRVVVLLLIAYVTITGFQASAIRASLFGVTALIAQLVGRARSSLRILLIIAALMLCWQPLLLLYDAGFQLSFLATGGIIIFQKPIERLLAFIPKQFTFRSTAATSLAAMITTTPLIMYSFETFSIIALLANTIVVPFMPFIMSAAIVSILVSVVFPQSVAVWMNIPLAYVLSFFISIVEWFSQLPYASVPIEIQHPLLIIGMYFLISIAAYICIQKTT